VKLLGYLEQFLDRDKGTVIAIANDGYIVEKVAEWILELDREGGHPILGKGNIYW